ncbi:MAG: redoxin domain-containing protein, partial [Actinomycetota bacterium]|nr:redoxin domain-containing protein [Actinomycetota bacterium]
RSFDDANQLNFLLLSDPDRTIAKQFGVKRPLSLPNKRQTFVIGRDRQIVAAIASETDMAKHADEALQVLGDLE